MAQPLTALPSPLLRVPARTLMCALVLWACLHEGSVAADDTSTGSHGSYAPLIGQAAPSVVTIFTTKTVKRDMQMAPPMGLDDPAFRHYFDADGIQSDEWNIIRRQGLGSGVIISQDGLVLTNKHFIDLADDAQDINIALADGHERYHAVVLGGDAYTDLAVLRITATGPLPAITVGDSTQVKVGDRVLAIGRAFGYGLTVTTGIISAHGHGQGQLTDDFFQTDASITPSNSGGALIDAGGHLIGITTAKISPNGGHFGIVVPIATACAIKDSIISQGRVVRGDLGLKLQHVTAEIAMAFRLPSEDGALVGDVVAGGPGARAGIRSGDVVVSFNAAPIGHARQLTQLAAKAAPGTTVTLGVWRDGKQTSCEVTVAEMGAPGDAPGNRDRGQDRQGNRVDLGLVFTDLDDHARDQHCIPTLVHGVMICSVAPGSPAEEAGITAGEVILEINLRDAASAAAAHAAISNAAGALLLRLWSIKGVHYVALPTAK
jgi:serine protease Do